MENFILTPYLGVRYIQLYADGFTEKLSSDVTTPLTYESIGVDLYTAVLGLKLTHNFGNTAAIYASGGLEQDINNFSLSLSASGVAGLVPINSRGNFNSTRPTATAGAYYNIDNTQRIGADLIWREEGFPSTSITTLLVKYTSGF